MGTLLIKGLSNPLPELSSKDRFKKHSCRFCRAQMNVPLQKRTFSFDYPYTLFAVPYYHTIIVYLENRNF